MGAHSTINRTPSRPDAAARPPLRGEAPGFRHLNVAKNLAEGAEAIPFRPMRIGGESPRINRTLYEDYMYKLYLRMRSEPAWAPVEASVDPTYIANTQAPLTDNPFIPSGYTYLLQFIAHDTVATRVPFWAVDDLTTETANDRRTRLRLETLYGDGPTGCPGIFAPDTKADDSRTKLQLGRVQVNDLCPFRDLARLRLENTLKDRAGTSEPLIADPRNDDHAIIAQLTMVFHHLHNVFVKLQPAIEANEADPDFTYRTNQRFERARDATTVVYRHVVRHDVMRRILHPDVYALYNEGQGSAVLDDAYVGAEGEEGPAPCPRLSPGMPLEFSHGAFRFAHAMSRIAYRINNATNLGNGDTTLTKALEATSNFDVLTNVPLKPLWLIQWAYFFDFKGLVDPTQINLSHRIGPHIPDGLVDPARFARINAQTLGSGVIYRDLISAGLAELWSVDALIDAIQHSPKHRKIVQKSPLLANRRCRQVAIYNWMASASYQTNADAPDPAAVAISEDPPLPFFVLFEAYHDPASNGCRLGVLGSIIVAEVIFSELCRNPTAAEKHGGTLNETLTAIYRGFSDDEAFSGDITMANVIQFIWKHLQDCLTEKDFPLIAPAPAAAAAVPEAAATPAGAAALPPAPPEPAAPGAAVAPQLPLPAGEADPAAGQQPQ